MIVTEKEAHEMWCPMFRRAGSQSNSDADCGRRTTCIASRCMMWRWALRNDEGEIVQSLGYCGLAGKVKPEKWS